MIYTNTVRRASALVLGFCFATTLGLLTGRRTEAADAYWILGGPGEEVGFIPETKVEEQEKFPNGHPADLDVVDLSLNKYDPQSSAPVTLSPTSGHAGNGRLPDTGHIEVKPTTNKDHVGECKILVTFDRDNEEDRLPSEWVTVDKWAVMKFTPVELDFKNDVPLTGNMGTVYLPDVPYKDADADGDTSDADDCDHPVCYVMNTRPRLDLKFKIEPPLPVSQKLWVWGGGLTTGSNEVYFQSSYSCSGSEHQITDLTSASDQEKVGDAVTIGDAEIGWSCCLTNPGDPPPCPTRYGYVGSTSASKQQPTKLYIVFGQPQIPMDKPWPEVLDLACDWGETATTEAAAVSPITTGAYTHFGKTHSYDGDCANVLFGAFNLERFLTSDRADCHSMAAFVYAALKALGSPNVKTNFIQGTFKFKCRLRTVGPILPKYRPGGGTDRYPAASANDDWSWAPDTGQWAIGCRWLNHRVVILNSKVYDPTAKVKGSSSPPVGMSKSNYEYMLWHSGTWVWHTPEDLWSCGTPPP